MRKIGKSLVRTTESERTYLVQQGLPPPQRRYLISTDDLRELIAHGKSRRQYVRRASSNESSVVFRPSSCSTPSSSLQEFSDDSELFEAAEFGTKDGDGRSNCTSMHCQPQQNACADNTTSQYQQQNAADNSTSMHCQQQQNACTDNTTSQYQRQNAADNSTSMHCQQQNACTDNTTSMHCQQQQNACTDNTTSQYQQQNAAGNSTSMHCQQQAEDIVVRKKASRRIGCLKTEDTSPELQLQLNQVTEFYSSAVNALRKCCAFSSSTLRKFVERVKCFLNFCRVMHREEKLDFYVVDNVDLVQQYITYQIEERKLNISTVVRTITALINLCKFVHRDHEDVDSCVQLVRLKNIQRQLSRRQQSYSLAAKAGLCGSNDKTPSFMFEHLLETIKLLKEKVDCAERDSTGRARLLHDFLMVSLYVTSMCGRSKEVRTLELFDESVEGKQFQFDWRRKCNVFVVSATLDKFTLYENDFKNLNSHGPSRFELDSSMWLIAYLKEYLVVRKTLLNGKSHAFMFMTATGLAFSSSSFTTYLCALFEREVKIRAGTTKLRHALVTHVLSLPEAESLRLRESLAELMRHSLKHQQRTYCDISRQDRTLLSRDLLNRSVEMAAAAQPIGSDSASASASATSRRKRRTASCSDDIVNPRSVEETQQKQRKLCTNVDVDDDVDDDDDDDDDVNVGDIVALLDGASSCAEDASIFVGRVMKVREFEAQLMEFRCVDESKRLYRALVGRSWWESLDALIHPIDIIYDRKNELYELRSSPADIYRVVHA